MENRINFDELVQKAFMPEAKDEDYTGLFVAVFSLDEWYFITDPVFPKLPYSAPFPNLYGTDRPWVTVFTERERAKKFIAQGGLKGDAAKYETPEDLITPVSTKKIFDYLDQLIKNGIGYIFFNPSNSNTGFQYDLKALHPLYELLKVKLLLSDETIQRIENKVEDQTPSSKKDFDELSRRTNRANPPIEYLNELYGAAFALPEWFFIARGEMPNVNPYIAANAGVASGQQMVRAFTDSEKLRRFAVENNLTDADGNSQILTIPTVGAVEFLEQFIGMGVHGIWFNSDSQSDGFFVPLAQLRPIREHLDKLKNDEKSKIKVVHLRIKDGLGFPGTIHKATQAINIFALVPSNWTDGEKLTDNSLERFYQFLYGKNWRMGNDDDSRYVVLSSTSKILDDETIRNTRWLETQNTKEDQYKFWNVGVDGKLESLDAEIFQALVDAEIQSKSTDEARQQQDNLAKIGVSETANGSFDQNLCINTYGNISLDTSIRPFYHAIVPLLKDYQGTGDFVTLMRYDPEGISELVEGIEKNAHGDYLQIRRFYYLNTKNNARLGINNIHSRTLRHIKTNASLIISFELVKIFDEPQAAIFYHRFEGASEIVLKLQEAIQPVLVSKNYEEVS